MLGSAALDLVCHRVIVMLSAFRTISVHGAGPTPEALARLGRWLALLLVVMLAWTLAQLTWTLFSPRETGLVPVVRDLPSSPPLQPLEPPRVPACPRWPICNYSDMRKPWPKPRWCPRRPRKPACA